MKRKHARAAVLTALVLLIVLVASTVPLLADGAWHTACHGLIHILELE